MYMYMQNNVHVQVGRHTHTLPTVLKTEGDCECPVLKFVVCVWVVGICLTCRPVWMWVGVSFLIF